MDTGSSLHPDDETLHAYGLGKLDDPGAEELNRHLEGCSECRRRVAEMSADSFLGRVRDGRHGRGSSTAGQPGIDATRSHAGAATSAPPPAETLPPGLADHPDYEIKRELGRGGMGVVYLAHNRLMGRDEVLKVMGRELVERPGLLDRFLREIRAVARLRHPNIVTAYSAVRIGESIVFAMEYVEGLDLSRLVKIKGPMPVAHACLFAQQAAQGLQHASEEGLVHRDIKPGNLILSRKGSRATVKVLDFGLAKATSEQKVDSALTREGQALGTPDFIAPEQILDAPNADIRADIYSLGGTLFYLLTGRPPFQAKSLYDLYQAHISRDADPLNLLRPQVPSELAALVAKMLAKEPGRRFQEPAEVAQALSPFLRKGAAGSGHEISRGAEPPPPPRPRPVAEASPARQPVPASTVTPPAEPGPAEGWASLIEIDEQESLAPPPTVPRRSDGGGRSPRPWLLSASAIGLAVVIAAFLVGWAAQVLLRVNTPEGTIVLRDLPPDAEVLVDDSRVSLTPVEGGEAVEITIEAGDYAVRTSIGTKRLVIKRGEDEIKAQRVTLTADDLEYTIELEEDERIAGAPESPPPSDSRRIVRDRRPIEEAEEMAAPVTVPSEIGATLGDLAGADESLLAREGRILVPYREWPTQTPTLDGVIRAGEYGDPIPIDFHNGKNPGHVIVSNRMPRGVDWRGGPEDLSAFLYTAYGNSLFIAILVYDQFIDDSEADADAPWYNDDAELFIDGDLVGNDFPVGERLGTSEGFQLVCDAAGRKATMCDTMADSSWAVSVGRFPGGLVYEFAIPLYLIDTQDGEGSRGPGAGSVLGLNIGFTDNDHESNNDYETYAVLWDRPGGRIDAPRFTGDKGWPVRLELQDPREASRPGDRGVMTPGEPAGATTGFQSLFNGVDLSGWTTHPSYPGAWGVDRGVLVGRGPRPSVLYTVRDDFEDVHVRAEARINSGGNSGVTIRSTFGSIDNSSAFPVGYEARICNTHRDPNKTGSLYGGSPAVLASVPTSPVSDGEWFLIELIAVGNHVTVKVNGEVTVDYEDEARIATRGHIALQMHNADTVAEFRKIEVKRLGGEGVAERPADAGTLPGADARAFGHSRYRAFPEELSWHEARARCEEMGGRLAVVGDARVQEFLLALMEDKGVEAAWLGASDERVEGQWVWVDGTLMTYTNWQAGPGGSQPNNKGGTEHYLVMIRHLADGTDHGGMWSDQPDRPHPVLPRTGFICEWLGAESGTRGDEGAAP